jgi:hypothetical protein
LQVRSKGWTLTAAAMLTIRFYRNLLRIYYVSKIDSLRKNLPPLSKKEAEYSSFAYLSLETGPLQDAQAGLEIEAGSSLQ